jgi:hypothetical protein
VATMTTVDAPRILVVEDDPDALERFYTTKSNGTGLGLAIIRRIIEAQPERSRSRQSRSQIHHRLAARGVKQMTTLPVLRPRDVGTVHQGAWCANRDQRPPHNKHSRSGTECLPGPISWIDRADRGIRSTRSSLAPFLLRLPRFDASEPSGGNRGGAGDRAAADPDRVPAAAHGTPVTDGGKPCRRRTTIATDIGTFFETWQADQQKMKEQMPECQSLYEPSVRFTRP